MDKNMKEKRDHMQGASIIILIDRQGAVARERINEGAAVRLAVVARILRSIMHTTPNVPHTPKSKPRITTYAHPPLSSLSETCAWPLPSSLLGVPRRVAASWCVVPRRFRVQSRPRQVSEFKTVPSTSLLFL